MSPGRIQSTIPDFFKASFLHKTFTCLGENSSMVSVVGFVGGYWLDGFFQSVSALVLQV